MTARRLVVVLGDQLDRRSSAFDGFDAARDVVCMAEAGEEATHVWSAKARIVMFLAAMRHFAAALRAEGLVLDYAELPDGTLAEALAAAIARHRPERVVLTEPGDWRVREALRAAAGSVPLDIRADRHFLCSGDDFADHARRRGARGLRMEFFYREMRQRHRILLDADGQPAGGRWNFDADNRRAFGSAGPGFLPRPPRFEPDAITRDVIALVERRHADHPGSTAGFAWPVTREQALAALHDFVDQRLPSFGHWQDAMWRGEPFLYHAQLSAALNLKLLDPREVIAAAVAAWRDGRVPLAAAEGYVRQIAGWREYARGVYWLQMPGYLEMNALDARADLPPWYWSGETPMQCLAETVRQTLAHGYAHHIQRLMVTGLYALLLGVDPRQVHGWYLSVYVDAVEWVELPNTLGMSQYADGGLMASKPYVASGRYIDRMSDYCRGCRYDPALRSGDRACPFTVLYWDFLDRQRARLAGNRRLQPQLDAAAAIPAAEMQAIRDCAAALRAGAA